MASTVINFEVFILDLFVYTTIKLCLPESMFSANHDSNMIQNPNKHKHSNTHIHFYCTFCSNYPNFDWKVKFSPLQHQKSSHTNAITEPLVSGQTKGKEIDH